MVPILFLLIFRSPVPAQRRTWTPIENRLKTVEKQSGTTRGTTEPCIWEGECPGGVAVAAGSSSSSSSSSRWWFRTSSSCSARVRPPEELPHEKCSALRGGLNSSTPRVFRVFRVVVFED